MSFPCISQRISRGNAEPVQPPQSTTTVYQPVISSPWRPVLWRTAREKDKRLATLSIDTVIRFRSPADRAAFTSDLTNVVAALAARYHDESAPGGRPHRLVVASYPAPRDARP
jgi:hypothetical protein